MGFRCGIVGLPNVGKSTLFNALTGGSAEAANFPFCTIDPNNGVVPLADPRLTRLSQASQSAKTTPSALEVVDIAGLVRGASKGEGLGNQFLMHIEQVDAIFHVVRCFEDENVVHNEGSVDPVRDIETIQTELLLKDLAKVEKKCEKAAHLARGGVKEAKGEAAMLERLQAHLDAGNPAINFVLDEPEKEWYTPLALVTDKPVLYVANTGESAENQYVTAVREYAASHGGAPVEVVSGQLEAEIAQLDAEERREYLQSMGLEESGLQRLARAGHRLLGMIVYFTTGPKETRAWTVRAGTKAPQAAGKIHSDFERGFISGEVVHWEDFEAFGSIKAARDKGRMSVEGKGYEVRDGDIVLWRYNV